MACPPGSTRLELNEVPGFRGMVENSQQNGRDTVTVQLLTPSKVWVGGWAKEGHPEEKDCKDGEECAGISSQDKEEFRVRFGEESLGEYRDKGLLRNKWFGFGTWETANILPADTYTITVEHLHIGEQGIGQQSVDYKLSFCALAATTP